MTEANGNQRLQPRKPKDDKLHDVEVPPWLIVMCSIEYFLVCTTHPKSKKNELDHFCINCAQSFCHNCLSVHALHKYVKIRRYVYCEVINRRDLSKLFNCAGIQAYHTNKSKVIFLKQRSQQQSQQQNQQHNCIVCTRSLQDASYCSIACKVSATHRAEHKKDNTHDHNNPRNDKDASFEIDKDRDNGVLKLSVTKRRRPRKGIPRRAPMF